MAYRKADMPFIHEATEVEEVQQVWEHIPFDETIQATEELVDLFKKNCSVFEFGAEASRRTVIDLFLREVVSQFPELMIICEYHMTLLNKAKRRRLNGSCDYTIVHRGHRNLPHLVAIEAKVTNKETLLQCIGECASIHFRRKTNNRHNRIVHGIHSTGSIWKFVYINEEGVVAVSKEFHLNAEHYVKEVDLIYRLVFYVSYRSRAIPPGWIGADVGCGNGKYLQVNKDIAMVGCDRSSELIKIVQDRGCEGFVSDGLATGFKSACFVGHGISSKDFVISIAVIHHFSTPERRRAAIAELIRITKPGRDILIFVWAMEQEVMRPALTDQKDSKRRFDSQDEMVPWVTQRQTEAGRESVVYHRYYHLFWKGELEELCAGLDATVKRAGYDRDNHYVVLTRIA
ncbi:tRNA methyltransferase, has a role in tRNA modification [Kappamyces sp. JEL0680]|nr:tRNA methyltransferase, has a role in tRNA modification [Kappamyces sp. JEL0680]